MYSKQTSIIFSFNSKISFWKVNSYGLLWRNSNSLSSLTNLSLKIKVTLFGIFSLTLCEFSSSLFSLWLEGISDTTG